MSAWSLPELPAVLAPYVEALCVVDALPGDDAREWRPSDFADGLRVKLASAPPYPYQAGSHWDGAVPRYACARLDLGNAALSPLVSGLRALASEAIADDGALYCFSFQRSQHACRAEVIAEIARLVGLAIANDSNKKSS